MEKYYQLYACGKDGTLMIPIEAFEHYPTNEEIIVGCKRKFNGYMPEQVRIIEIIKIKKDG